MTESPKSWWVAKYGLLFILFGILIGLSYSNTFDASWHFDDKPNIVNNKGLHINDLKPESLARTLFTSPTTGGSIGKRFYRPIPCLTFALNWYLGKDQVKGYHVVNLLIHILVSFFLFLTILNILKAPNLSDHYKGKEYFIAFVAAAIWALNPIQIQAVTYIVQRMASMAAMFYIISIYLYVKCRQSKKPAHRVGLLFGCMLSFVFAVGSKENAFTLPLALLLVEVLFYQDLQSQRDQKLFFWGFVGGGLLIVGLGIWFFIPSGLFSYLDTYNVRPFSLQERLLTEPRIVLFYLSQIFYPLSNRLSIEHDIELSTSLFQPWSTLPAILIITLLIGLGFSQFKKRPLIAFAILFFFLNHIIESSFIPLELIFEHRNYLPSLFIFLPVALGCRWLYDASAGRRPAVRMLIVGSVALLLLSLGVGTYSRNRDWATEKTLWEDAMAKAPGKARPVLNLAWDLAYGENEKTGQYDKALALYFKALPLKGKLNIPPAITYGNIAGVYAKKKEYLLSVHYYQKALDINPDYRHARANLLNILIFLGRWEDALTQVNVLTREQNNGGAYLNLKGTILLRLKKTHEALRWLEKAAVLNPNNIAVHLNHGMALSLSGEYQQAEMELNSIYRLFPRNITVLLCLLENSVRAGDALATAQYADRLFNTFDPQFIFNSFNDHLANNFQVPLTRDLIEPVISKRMMSKG